MDIRNAFAPAPTDYPNIVAAWQISERQAQPRRSVRAFRPELLEGLNIFQRYVLFFDEEQLRRLIACAQFAHRIRVVEEDTDQRSGLYGQFLADDGRVNAVIYVSTWTPHLLGETGFCMTQLDAV